MKRAESQIQSFYNLFENEIRVQLIAEPLFLVSKDADAVTTAAHLLVQGYDECGVQSAGSVTEIVKGVDLLCGQVADHVTTVPIERLVSTSTPIWSCLSRLASYRSLFVLGEHEIDGIVTLADIDKQPGRLLIFGLISMLEMVMLALVKQHYLNNEWQRLISRKRLERAQNLYRVRRELDQQIDLIECIQLCDKFNMCLKTQGLRVPLELDEGFGDTLFADLEQVRNNLAHGHSAATGKRWTDVVETLQGGHRVLEKAIDLLRSNGQASERTHFQSSAS